MSKKKIIFLISSLGTGGAERQMVILLELLFKYNITPKVLTYYGTEKDYSVDFEIEKQSINNASFFLRYMNVFRVLSKEKPEIVLSYTWLPNLLSIFYSFFNRNVKVIISERNTTLKKTLLKKLLFFFYRFSDVIIVNSYSQTRYFEENNLELLPKIRTITNYIDISKYKFVIKEKKQIIKIAIFARYHPQKNILNFIEAVDLVNKKGYSSLVEFHWYGEFFILKSGKYSKNSLYYLQCNKKRELLNLKNLFFHNFETNVQERILCMDAICLPSFYEGFSNILSESICSCKPILASDVCDNPLFVKNNYNGFLFDPTSVDDMASAIENFICISDADYQLYQRNSRALAELLFSEKNFIESYLDVLNN
ncbi:glycosyltransferase involved in cell wall biosynthesis [Parabacteroides sp. PF5-5]|uniref:glycosyltransferase family 4 protein n=1 Tax=unclassified Parabacteroides TaxID=2649774 RepID=UPI002473C863|nr:MULTISPECIES: glycosyltransferase family 4 protein [unclassified Parabacteroides]MDH6316373.1 glycosyltransferase involved in cell wall biosynthesis [Parabacteroides sp. PF5-13]MDH6327560.1 glycosyltransferase involved in cell wall biosynthesis [Parabacteroides sp. PH5-41]MDH6335300.1 glycosyltransferase involved in cell wall biosynthesis [Parabacteroides sp. PF5-5]MDH6346363.1 glycosyltransferase involved in cell wall biosynthesis [Parabacteroides sp. PH5-46]MDH6361386.1 glycosyltransferas